MIRRKHAFYRSTLVRWALMLSGFVLADVFAPWSPTSWHASPSLLWLHRYAPWGLISTLFLVYALLLLWGTVRVSVWATWLGLFLYVCTAIALCATASGHPTNPLVYVALFLTCVLHYAAGRLALIEQEDAR